MVINMKILITGATSGIAYETALKLLEQNKNSVSISYESLSAQGKSIISEDIFSELHARCRDYGQNPEKSP